MATEVLMPSLRPTMTSGTIVRWSKKEGERAVKDEELAIFESEDATYEIVAPVSGVLLSIVRPAGSSVAVGQVVARIGEPGEGTAPPSEAAGPAPASAQAAAAPGPRLETQMGLKVKEVVPLSETRRTIGKRLSSSLQSTAQVTLVYEADASELVRLREAVLPEVEARTGVRVTYTDLLVKAVARALREHPVMNSTLEDDGIKLIDEVNVGVAVATERGLIVPVLRNADALDLVGVVTSMKEMASRGREGKLKLKEVTSGTFTITNLGMTAVDSFTPILNPPQVGILGVGRIVRKPVVVEGDRVEVRSRVTLSLTFDHRIVDGAPAAAFLQTVVELFNYGER